MKSKGQRVRIILFRHGQTDWNLKERFQGHIDIPLNETGRQQARDLVSILSTKKLEAILSSDLSRARETGEIVAQGLNIPVFQDSGLREAFLGHAQGLTRDEIEAKFGPEMVKGWKSAKVTDADLSYPGGETGNEVRERAQKAIIEFVQKHPYTRIGVATHGGVIRRIMQRLLPLDFGPVPIPNGVTYEITLLDGVFELSASK